MGARYLSSNLSRFVKVLVRQKGEVLYVRNAIQTIEGDRWHVHAKLHDDGSCEVSVTRLGNDIHVECTCPAFEDDGTCPHAWAVLLESEKRNFLLGQMGGTPKRLIDDLGSQNFIVPDDFVRRETYVRKPPPPRPPPPPRWKTALEEIRRGSAAPRLEAWPEGREIFYVIDGESPAQNRKLNLTVEVRDRRRDGEWGKVKTGRIHRHQLPQIPDADRELLVTLGGGGSAATYYHDGTEDPFPVSIRLPEDLWEMLLPKLCATGRCIFRRRRNADPNMRPLRWDGEGEWRFSIDAVRDAAGCKLRGLFTRNGEEQDLKEAGLVLSDGLVITGETIARFRFEGDPRWVTLLRKETEIQVPEQQWDQFLGELVESGSVPPITWPPEMGLEVRQGSPQPVIRFSMPGKQYGYMAERASSTLLFDYFGVSIEAADAKDGVYDPQSRVLVQRDRAAEDVAIRLLDGLGMRREVDYALRPGSTWNVSAKRLPAILSRLVSSGWRVESEGKLFRSSSSYHAELSSGIDWFELNAQVDYEGVAAGLPELLKALEKGENYVTLADGSLGMVPEEFQQQWGRWLKLGSVQQGKVRFTRAQAGFLDLLLADRAEIQFDETFARLRKELAGAHQLEAAPQPAGFQGQLRDYQQLGLAWMLFLQKLGLGGCLADDMGVGKTPQVLALLETRRAQAAGPSLVVVPRTLVQNWMLEAARFTPQMRVLDHTGVGRSTEPEHLEKYDLILSTYGTLRRDVLEFREFRFDYAILDEAQNIKNANSESAKAARLLQANHRLVMTGTPIENHLGELWSLLDFLNPGVLGRSTLAKAAGASLRNPDPETRELLARAIRPYVLRRTKDQVARELPPKVEQTLYCELEERQRTLYNELRDHYRRSLLGRVEEKGLAKSQIQILEALLRLRQAACHPGLIDARYAAEPSAKLETLMDQLGEVIEEGHKALVFSQFTSLLAFVRRGLEERGIVYEYLDGQTRDRQARVDRFQTDAACPVFLLSLKAGGYGLNLTAADYAFLLDPWWNPAVESQAVDRAHRIGQTRSVFAYRLIARDTVEEKVLEMQATKRELANAIIKADQRVLANLKREDLELLLS